MPSLKTIRQKLERAYIFGILITTSVMLINCSSGVKRVEYPESTDVKTKHQEVMTMFHNQQQRQVDVLSAKEFKSGEQYLDRATKTLDLGDEREQTLKNLGMAEAFLRKAQDNADKVQKQVEVALNARQQALFAGAKDTRGPALARLDQEFARLNKEVVDGGKLDTANMISLQERYLNLQSRSIQTIKLADAYSLLNQARSEGAVKYAPQTFEAAQARVKAAENIVFADRDNQLRIDEETAAAVTAAQKAVEVNRFAKEVKGFGTNREETALNMWDKEAQLRAARVNLENTQFQNQSLAAEQSSLYSRVNRLSATAQELQSETDWNNYIKSAQTHFSNEEAEVFRQGDKLIVRLKAIRFPSNRADLPTSAIETLKKVTDVAAGMDAQQLIIEGHTDSVGSAAMNKELSLRRAESVKQYFANAGTLELAPEDIETQGMGFDRPLTTNKTAIGRATNRRVDVIIVP